MPSIVVLVRHAEPRVIPGVPRSRWSLTDEGHRAASELGVRIRKHWGDLPIVASSEIKTIETAHAISVEGGAVVSLADLREVEHPWFTRREDHNEAALRYIAGHDLAGWEPAASATARFGTAIEAMRADHVVVVSHGTVMSLWVKNVVPSIDAGAFWTTLSLPDAWVVDLRTTTVVQLS